MVIGEALVQFKSDAGATIEALKSVSGAAQKANDDNKKASDTATAASEKYTKALDGVKQKIKESVDASKEFATAFLAAATAVGAAAVGFSVKAVEAYNEHEQAVTQMNAVLKSTGQASGQTSEALQKNAEMLQRVTGASRDTVMAGQNMLLTFTEIKGKTFPEATQAILDMSTAMNSGAIPSAENLKDTAIQVGKALNDPIKGIAALHRVGVAFTDQQKEQIQAMQDAGNMAGAQAIVLKELEKEFGGSAAAAGQTFAGQIAKAKNTVQDLMVNIGKLIVDHLTPLVHAVNNWADSMGGPDAILRMLIERVKDAGTWLLKHRDEVLILAGAIAGPLVVALGSFVVGIAATVLAIAPFLIVGALVAAMITRWVEKHGGLKQSLEDLRQKFNEAKQWYNEHQDLIHNVIIPAVEGLTGAIIAFKVAMAIGKTVETAQAALTVLRGALTATQGGVGMLSGAISAIPLAIVIGVAIAGYEAVMSALKGLQDELNAISNTKAQMNTQDNQIKAMIDDAKKKGDTAKVQALEKAYQLGPAKPAGGGIMQSFLGFASGVNNFAGGVALVGEQGPELVNLPAGSDVIPAGQTASLLAHAAQPLQSSTASGATINNTFQVGNLLGTPQAFRDLVELVNREQTRITRRT